MNEHANDHAAKDHASTGTYLKIAAILCAITALEFGVIYVRRLAPILVPLLLVLSAGKFALVVMFFMHLRYDNRSLTFVFVAPLVLAALLALALMTVTGDFLVFKR
ncbi:MAG TPA: cytochrome C oxidase subunit IV family protein [Methylomirabilota bacterium]|jgi:cytochrome c oxidase subunit 4|nr:cytochrome C oxidase subunit IV family protein [Methylomirabilota bacterium]